LRLSELSVFLDLSEAFAHARSVWIININV
jgi:hypothetical protein